MPNVIEIEDFAFRGCEYLVSVSADKVKKIGERAFSNCESITSLSFPEVTEIGEAAFNKCIKVNEISLPKLTKVSKDMFISCDSLEEIDLPSVTELDTWAFEWTSLKSITFGSQITVIGRNAFSDLESDCVITFAKGQKDFVDVNDDGNYTISENEVEAGDNKMFCGQTFAQIIIAE